VFGGTFDPIHKGHVAVAEAALESLNLNEVMFVVTSDQWLRGNPPQATAEDRFRMVELAVENVLEFIASDVDILREGSTYTVDTLRDLRAQLGDSSELFLIVGADSAISMDRWKEASVIAELATIVAVGRPAEQFDSGLFDNSHPASGAEYVEGPMIDVSATRVRDLFSTGQAVGDLVDEKVSGYIEKRNLYHG